MGLTYITLNIANPAKPKRALAVKMLVDSGATLSVLPRAILDKLGIASHSMRTFTLANGETIERKVGDAIFIYDGVRAPSLVVFGEQGDNVLLGTVTLESLGFGIDPIRRKPIPLPMILA